MKPQHDHTECPSCQFVGRVGSRDLWICDVKDSSFVTMMVRHSSKPSDYASNSMLRKLWIDEKLRLCDKWPNITFCGMPTDDLQFLLAVRMSLLHRTAVNTSPDYMEGVVLTATLRPATKFDSNKMTHADYRCMVGSRRQNMLLANAGLGITGAFEPIIYTIDWNPGEVVDTVRAEKLCAVLMQGLNESGELTCNNVELVHLYQ